VNNFEVEPSVAVITARVHVLTAVVVTVKLAVDDPALTVTALGTFAFALLLCSDTLVLLAAVPLNDTVHVEDVGGVKLDGLQLKLDSTIAGFNVTVNDFEVEPKVAVITAEVWALTAVVVTVKLAVDDPALTVTALGTVEFALLLCSAMLVLLAAAPLKLTVQVEDAGGVKLDGLQLKLDSTIAGFNVTVNGFEVEPKVAVITAEVWALTAVVVTVKLAVDDPALTVTALGTVAFALLLCSATLVLLAAAPLKLTVQVDDAGGVTVAGLQVRFVRMMTGWLMVTNPLPPVIEMPLPLPSDANAPEMYTSADVSVALEEIWKVTETILPLAMTVVLNPATIHRTSPADGLLHVAVFPAAEAAAPVE
jgi:hypothetical protein